MSNPKVPVTHYAAQWNPQTKVGNIIVRAGGKPYPLPPMSAPDFNAMMLMLSKTGLVLDTKQWDFELDFRPVGP